MIISIIMTLKTELVVFICVFLIQININGQNGISFNYFPDKTPKEVIFANNKAYDIGSNNPFLFEFPVTNQSNNIVYYDVRDISKNKIQDVIQMFMAVNDSNIKDYEWTNFITFPVPCEQTQSYFAVSYLFTGFSERTGAIGSVSSVYVYDSLGNLIFKKENLPLDINEILITENGKYLAYSFGADYQEKNKRIVNPGIHVFETKSGNKIDEIIIDPKRNHLVGLGLNNKNIISLVIEDPYDKEYEIYFFHANDEKVYGIAFPYNVYSHLESIDNKGIVISNLDSDTVYYSEMPIVEGLK